LEFAMDVNNLGTVPPAPTSRPQNTAREAPRAASGSAAAESETNRLAVSAPLDAGDEQPDPSTPRGSLLDISV